MTDTPARSAMILEFELALAMASFIDDDGFIGVQIDGIGGQESGLQPYELHHPFGFISRPSDPVVDANGTPSGGCSVLFAREGSRAHAWLAADGRVIPNLMSLKKGESAQYGAAGQFIRCHEDGSISFFTTDAGGGPGQSVTMRFAPDGFEWSAPWGRFKIDGTGFHFLDASGARIDLGAIGGLPSPLDALSSYARISAGAIRLQGGVVALGAGENAEPAAKATTLLVYLALLQKAVALLNTAVASATGADPTSLTALTALLPELIEPPDIVSSVTVS